MTKFICIIALCLAFMSCKKEPQDVGCVDDARSAYYLDFWKTEFLKRNAMSPDYFQAHISGIRASSTCWNNGITFRVSYKVTIDWAVIDNYDEFMVQLSSNDNGYGHLNIPRDTFLDTDQLQIILDKSVGMSAIGPVRPITSLKYRHYNEALEAFQDSTKSDVILPESMSYFVPGKLPRKDGYPYFIGSGTINRSLNQCIFGHFNLATGESFADTTACEMQ